MASNEHCPNLCITFDKCLGTTLVAAFSRELKFVLFLGRRVCGPHLDKNENPQEPIAYKELSGNAPAFFFPKRTCHNFAIYQISDSGTFLCKGVNGFGSAQAQIELLVSGTEYVSWIYFWPGFVINLSGLSEIAFRHCDQPIVFSFIASRDNGAALIAKLFLTRVTTFQTCRQTLALKVTEN